MSGLYSWVVIFSNSDWAMRRFCTCSYWERTFVIREGDEPTASLFEIVFAVEEVDDDEEDGGGGGV